MARKRDDKDRAHERGRIKGAVLAAWLRTGEALTAADISAAVGMPVARVRRAMSEAQGCVDGLVCRQETRASDSRDYPGMGFTVGAHKVWVYEPSKELLRTELNAARGRLESLANR